jgi:trehalose 6-phosphate synthase/phosphatase
MTTFYNLQDFFRDLGYKIIIVGDGEPRAHVKIDDELVMKSPAGGVSVAFDAVARASNAVYIANGKTDADREAMKGRNKIPIETPDGSYELKRIFLTPEQQEGYYLGFSNQTLWPLSHAAFERPIFNPAWYETYVEVNKIYAKAIKEEIKGKTFIWINDYQLAMVPAFLGDHKDSVVGFFWHIPWPTWEIFRVLPQKKDILWSLLSCDFLAFHRRYQAQNFMTTVSRELEVRIDTETNSIFFDKNILTVADLPMGIDTDTIEELAKPQEKETFLTGIIRQALGIPKEEIGSKKTKALDAFFEKYQVLLGVDRLDYTKGLVHRLEAIDRFFEKYPQYIEKAVYLGIMSPTREGVPSYKLLRKEVENKVKEINKKYATDSWKPLRMIYESYTREDVIRFYEKADVSLVTPLDDGMNLVSKEFVVAASVSHDPGVLILSQFAGSAIDLTAALIINPYNIEEGADAIARALQMPAQEKKERMQNMFASLEERNIYDWTEKFVKRAITASRENRDRASS